MSLWGRRRAFHRHAFMHTQVQHVRLAVVARGLERDTAEGGRHVRGSASSAKAVTMKAGVDVNSTTTTSQR